MQDLIPQLWSVEITAPAVVSVVLLTRMYFGSVLLAPRYVRAWNVARRILAPLIDKLAASRLPTSPSLLREVDADQYVATTPTPITDLVAKLVTVRDLEVPLLAGYKTDWLDRAEDGTLVWYYGSKPWPTAPHWLRPYQVHLTIFGDTITAHREANPWRPDRWPDHLFLGASYSVEDGVARTLRLLDDAGVEYDQLPQQECA